MNEADRNNLYSKVLNKWGFQSQMLMTIEEMAELTKALLHDSRVLKNPKREALFEEIADVEIMLGQMKLIYGCGVTVEKIKEKKLKRLKKLVEGN